ncbi:hypothetical protein RSOLAG1IB_06947 [Rhizoctonia solani AG-1 IB]|uniref:Uncharacterized protein n=1 Tax=Thanatephorus cucumeris (strain AG1-IB / isolate 7/3/14) TaxID=1108050 RepID=A0A0B7FBH6_THACB|nr:hypothetical protein RSOLAG1IB_06947 [Rhizoctonia solani AG-1 IB]
MSRACVSADSSLPPVLVVCLRGPRCTTSQCTKGDHYPDGLLKVESYEGNSQYTPKARVLKRRARTKEVHSHITFLHLII